MNIKVCLKSISKTRGFDYIDYEISNNVSTLADLIVELCDIEIDKYENNEFKVLNQDEINDMVNIGKVSFGFKYREDVINREEAYQNALLSFEDGLYKVFINDSEVDDLKYEVDLSENDVLVFIRLVMMSGWNSY